MFQQIATEQLDLNMKGMAILVLWSLGNIILGLIWARRSKGYQKHFYIANAAWNVINLLIAGTSIFMLSRITPAHDQLKDIIYRYFNFEKIVLLNVGLDIAYIAIGSFLVERGKHIEKPNLIGYGKALWLQGGFLFILDFTLYAINSYYNQKYAIYILF